MEGKSRQHKTPTDLPWVEKYRPKTLDDIAHQEDVVLTLRTTLSSGNLPHLLFYGPPGTGKTSTILAVARQLYGPDLMKRRVLELNASNERGIDVIRNKVKSFAQIAVGKDMYRGKLCPPYKIIILDEADAMTRDAQSALRRTMEKYTKVTRFCIICNYVSRIIEPIASRCAKFRYKALSPESMTNRLAHIASQEAITCPPETVQALVSVSGGDMRKSITLMQSARRLVDDAEPITPDMVSEVAGVVPSAVVEGLFRACIANEFSALQAAAQEVVLQGYPVDQVMGQFQAGIIESADLSDSQKALVCIRIAEADKKLIDGADEHLQLMDILSFATQTFHGSRTS